MESQHHEANESYVLPNRVEVPRSHDCASQDRILIHGPKDDGSHMPWLRSTEGMAPLRSLCKRGGVCREALSSLKAFGLVAKDMIASPVEIGDVNKKRRFGGGRATLRSLVQRAGIRVGWTY
jgi:hypothetical protein